MAKPKQNQNESLNVMIWDRVPKGRYVGLKLLEIGVFDAVSTFNIGNMADIRTYEKLGIVAGDNMRKGYFAPNTYRITNSRRQRSGT